MFYKVITTIAVTVAVFVLAAQTPNPRGSDGIAIPLTKRSDTDARQFHATSHNAKIIRGQSGMDGSERNATTQHPSAVQRAGTGASVGLTKYTDGIWYGTISIGTPPMYFAVLLNTGSSDLVVPASTGDENCRSHYNLWDPAESYFTNLDLKTSFQIGLADNRMASGRQYWDNVTIAGLTADIQTVGAATTYSSGLKESVFAPDGILGLAFPPLSVFHGQSPLFHTLFNEGKISQPVFSLKLTSSGGELYVGGTNQVLYIHSTLVFTPVINTAGLWAVKIDNIKVKGAIVVADVPAIIDTGANLIFGDRRRALAVHKAAGGKAFLGEPDGYYTIPCRYFPSMTFTIGGRAFVVPARALNKGQIKLRAQYCFTGIVTVQENAEYWTIGTILLEHFYTVFDFNSQSPRFGIAELTPAY